MNIVAKEKIKVLAETNGWSLARAEGYVDGETSRKRGKAPSTYAKIGIDEYCLGFRASYYERQTYAPITSHAVPPVIRLSLRKSNDPIESIDATTVPAHGG